MPSKIDKNLGKSLFKKLSYLSKNTGLWLVPQTVKNTDTLKIKVYNKTLRISL